MVRSQERLSSELYEKGNNDSPNTATNSQILSPESAICKKILQLDRSIRYSGICSADGKLLASEYREEITPLLNEAELEFSAINSVIRALEKEMITAAKLGRQLYSVSAYENVKRATFWLDDGKFLLISFEGSAVDSLIVSKVQKEMNLV